jgi:hypothetical protein
MFTQLVGASDGAEQWQIDAALQGTAEIDPGVAPWLAALAIREQGAVSESIAAALRSRAHGYEALVAWLVHLKNLPQNTAPIAAPAECDLPLSYAMATIVLKDRTPIQWRTIASAYYFVGQRPYFSHDGKAQPAGAVFGYGGLGLSGRGTGGLGAPADPADITTITTDPSGRRVRRVRHAR